eukprot:TRINITY_DN329_c0_g3_i1.p1 TRINITY_DN329_c0_g3~~TRINITY_DN329_c0_g3_i1.p1  ORF type:complete len:534 (-),score=92.49 TRINITY_DN329_c0_g3_i1:719-2320(-)
MAALQSCFMPGSRNLEQQSGVSSARFLRQAIPSCDRDTVSLPMLVVDSKLSQNVFDRTCDIKSVQSVSSQKKQRRLTKCAVSSVVDAVQETLSPSRGGNIKIDPLDVIMMQGFNWESSKNAKGWYNVVASNVDEIASAGVTSVWLPPPSQSVAPQGYMPSQLYNLNACKYGNEEQLKSLIDKLHAAGVCAIGDIVINHRCGDQQDEHGTWNVFEGGTPDDRLDWGPWAIAGGDHEYRGQGQNDTGEDYGAAPDIDHTNERVQNELANWMKWLKHDIGFDGWRYDFVKGFGGTYVGLYNERTQPEFSVGEYWTSLSYGDGVEYNQDNHRQQLVNWIDATGGRSTAFDFTTKGVLQEAVNGQLWRLRDPNNKPAGLIGYWPQKAVTFLDNHDTGSTQGHWPFPSGEVMQGYAYILTHPGVPCVFWDHYFDWGLKEEIKALIAVRKRNSIRADAAVDIVAADGDLYVARINDRVVVKLGPRMDLGGLTPPEGEFKVAAFGNNYCVWEKAEPLPQPEPTEPLKLEADPEVLPATIDL